VRALAAIAVLVLVGVVVGAAQARLSRPRDLVAAVFAAQDSGNVAALIRLVDPDAMEAFKQQQLDLDSTFGQFPVERGTGEARRTMLQVVFRVRDRAEFRLLTPETVLARWFEQEMNGRARVFMQWPGSKLARREILGEVPDTGQNVHVVFREAQPAPAIVGVNLPEDVRIRVITVRRTPAGWRVRLNGGLVFEEGGSWAIGYSDEDDAGVPPP
jgi:hypothetical protein